MQDVFVVKGETSRSHEIDEKGFHEKLCVSDGSRQLEITPSVIEARNLSENTRVEQTHDGTGQPVERNSSTAHTVKEKMLMKYIVKLRHSTRTTCSIVKSTRRTSTSTFQDYHILPWNNCMAPAFENWFRKSRTIQIDMLFNKICDRINHLIPSAKNQKKWFMKLGT